eukprot:Sspe_Gene.56035::Locus_30829_Transcript_2_2_Confidence_0.400_Length_5241::g.56035::m.56035/K03284/corA; magnesium transporter
MASEHQMCLPSTYLRRASKSSRNKSDMLEADENNLDNPVSYREATSALHDMMEVVGGVSEKEAIATAKADPLWGEFYASGKILLDTKTFRSEHLNLQQMKNDTEFWMGLTMIGGNSDLRAIDLSFSCDQSILDSRYDLTPQRIFQIYTRYDSDNNGEVSLIELKKGLLHQGFRLPEEAITQVIQRFRGAADLSIETISIPEFGLLLQRLKLAELFLPALCDDESEQRGLLENSDFEQSRRSPLKSPLGQLELSSPLNPLSFHGSTEDEETWRSSLPVSYVTTDVKLALLTGDKYQREQLFCAGRKPSSTEGLASSEWIVRPYSSSLKSDDMCEAVVPDAIFEAIYKRVEGTRLFKRDQYVIAKQFHREFSYIGTGGLANGTSGNYMLIDHSAGRVWDVSEVEFNSEFTIVRKKEVKLSVVDYNADQIDVQSNLSAHSKRFFFGSRDRRFRMAISNKPRVKSLQMQQGVRWVHCDKLDKLTLLRLAVKYHLHPLSIGDAFSMENQPSKMDKHGRHFFLAINVVQLRQPLLDDEVPGDDGPLPVVLSKMHVAMFVAGPPRYDTVITISHNPHGADQNKGLVKDIVGLLRHEMQAQYFKVREFGSDFLMHTILSRFVDECQPIISAYRERLFFFLGKLRQRRTAFSPSWLEEISRVRMELIDLHRLVRPIKRIAIYAIHDKDVTNECRVYLEDIQDRVESALDDITQLIDMCKQLMDDFNLLSERRTSHILFILTVASTIFLPAQFVTGMYGMNFQSADGEPGIPELTWAHGYTYFWCLIGGITTVMLCLFKLLLRRG